MSHRLTWDDLLIQNLAEADVRQWLAHWSGWLTGEVTGDVQFVAMSKFGDWFLRRRDGSTDELSVIEGTYSAVAETPDEFTRMLSTASWQEDHLRSQQVLALHERGRVPAAGQCYGFAPHPVWTGRIDLDHAMLMPIGAWQSICSQTLNRQRPKGNDVGN
jgi:hypothetical protein